MSEIKRKSFHYKKAKFTKDGKLTLEDCLRQAVAKQRIVLSRQQEVLVDGETGYRLINEVSKVGGLLCGVMMSYTEGTHQNIVNLDAKATQLNLNQVAPTSENPDERAEFVEGLLYFGILKNHIIVIGSAHLRAKRFESHLNWLLGKKTGVIPTIERVLIADPIKPDYSQRKYKGLKSIKMSSHMNFEEPQSEDLSSQKLEPTGLIWEAVTDFMRGIGAETPEVNFSGGLNPEDLEIDLRVKWKNRRRNRANLLTPVLDPIANAFRHIDDAPIELEFNDGTTIKGGDFKVTQQIGVQCPNGIPNSSDVFAKMSGWLHELLAKGDIDPE